MIAEEIWNAEDLITLANLLRKAEDAADREGVPIEDIIYPADLDELPTFGGPAEVPEGVLSHDSDRYLFSGHGGFEIIFAADW